MPTSTVENYLKTIHSLADGKDTKHLVPVGKVAEHLGLTPGSATTMMKHLEQAGYVNYAPRKGVRFTREGRTAARKVLRRHRLIELFLVEVMKLDWSQVHEEAEILEHAFSDRLIERIDEMLGRPDYDPHGDPIPDQNGVMPARDLIPLPECPEGKCQLVRVTREDPETLRWLQQRGMTPGARFDLVSKNELAGVFAIVTSAGQSISIGISLAECLWVAKKRGV
ncbi:MAG: metal-dependent transcriptional regulator [Verrucomicrobiota bacterium]